MDVSIIIVNYNTLDLTQACIDSVLEKTEGVSFEIILVDNASSDGSKELFEKDVRIRYIYSNENLGFGKANNLGYEVAKGKYIFLLNSDTLLIDNSLPKLFQFMEKHANTEKIGACGCRLVNLKGDIIHSYSYFPSVKSIFLGFAKKISNRNKQTLVPKEDADYNSKGYFNVDYITGADLFVHRRVIEELKDFFDPGFFMYFEETDFQYRIAQRGYNRCIIDGTHIVHMEGASQIDIQKQKNYFNHYFMYLTSLNYFLKKNYSFLQLFSYKIVFSVTILPKILKNKMSNQERLCIFSLLLGFALKNK